MPSGQTRRRAAIEAKKERVTTRRGDPDELGVEYRSFRGRPQLRLTVDPDPMVALMGVAALRSALEEVERQVVDLGLTLGYSWDDLGWSVGLTAAGLRKRHPAMAS